MINYGVYLVIPGSFTMVNGETVETNATRYTLFRSGNEDKDFIYNMSLSLEVNKAGSFSFSILPSHSKYATLRRYIHYVSVENLDDDEVVFYGRIYSINMGFNGEKKVTVEGILSNLLDGPMYNVIDSSSAISGTLSGLSPEEENEFFVVNGTPGFLFEAAIRAYRNLIRKDIDVGNVFNQAYTYEEEKIDVSSGQTFADFILNELVGSSGGYVVARCEKTNGGNVNVLLDWIADAETVDYSEYVNSQVIEYGINLLDIEAEFANDDIITGIVPSWTDENDDKHWAIEVAQDVDDSSKNILKPYIARGGGTNGIGIQIIDLPELTDQTEALTVARRYADKYCNYNLTSLQFDSFRVKALDMHYCGDPTEQKIELLDQVRIISDYHGIDGVYTCTAMTTDLIDPTNNEYTFNIFRPKANTNDKTLCRQLGIKKSEKRKVHID